MWVLEVVRDVHLHLCIAYEKRQRSMMKPPAVGFLIVLMRVRVYCTAFGILSSSNFTQYWECLEILEKYANNIAMIIRTIRWV